MQAFCYDTIDSTNDEAKRLVQTGKITKRAYVVAREQSNGKGRMGRRWVSPKDAGVYLSVVEIDIGRTPADATAFTLAAGVACVEAIREVTGINVAIRPINDLYVEGAKLGGILTETLVEGGLLQALITGIGINVRQVDRSLPADSAPICCLEGVRPAAGYGTYDLSTRDLIQAIVANVIRWNAVAITGDRERIQRVWERCTVSQTDSRSG